MSAKTIIETICDKINLLQRWAVYLTYVTNNFRLEDIFLSSNAIVPVIVYVPCLVFGITGGSLKCLKHKSSSKCQRHEWTPIILPTIEKNDYQKVSLVINPAKTKAEHKKIRMEITAIRWHRQGYVTKLCSAVPARLTGSWVCILQLRKPWPFFDANSMDCVIKPTTHDIHLFKWTYCIFLVLTSSMIKLQGKRQAQDMLSSTIAVVYSSHWRRWETCVAY